MTREPEFFYTDNGVPKNRLGLEDAEVLSLIEHDLTHTRLLEIKNGTAPEATRSGRFDLAHLQAIHQHLFQDVYEWAGTTRSHDFLIEGQRVQPPAMIHKDDDFAPVPFVLSRLVDQNLNATFTRLQQEHVLQGLPRAEFADRAAQVFSEVNQAHPFMEGNGRTQREFMVQLAQQAGHMLNFDVVSSQRMSIVSLEARMGDQSGMQRLFQEITSPERVALLERAEDFLDREQKRWQNMYVATATPGREYTGQVALSSPELVVMASGGDVIVAQISDFDTSQGPPKGTVQIRATEYAPPAPELLQRQIDLEL